MSRQDFDEIERRAVCEHGIVSCNVCVHGKCYYCGHDPATRSEREPSALREAAQRLAEIPRADWGTRRFWDAFCALGAVLGPPWGTLP